MEDSALIEDSLRLFVEECDALQVRAVLLRNAFTHGAQLLVVGYPRHERYGYLWVLYRFISHVFS